nr:hypothetical protein [Sphingomonas sp. GC_Shp_6]
MTAARSGLWRVRCAGASAPRVTAFARALLLLSAFASPAAAQTLPHVQTDAEALAQDAGEYARHYGVPPDEAARRLMAQRETVGITDALVAAYGDRLAGIVVEHRPAFRIVVLLTGSDPVADRSVTAGGITVPIVFHTGATATRGEIVSAIMLWQADIRAMLPHPPGMGADPRTGAMVVMVNESDAGDAAAQDALAARIATMTGVPVRVAVYDRPAVDMAVEGGGRIVGPGASDGRHYVCTTGFAVSDGTRDGIVTAAHCPDQVDYVDGAGTAVPLAFVGQWGWGFQDVQVNAAPMPLAADFYADTAKTALRPATAVRIRASTRAGDFVCHRGERTGYSCAEIAMVDFAPAGDLCGGACLPTWVAVEGPTCRGGDSGAPVFDGGTALGLVKGGTYRSDGSCVFYYYMSLDYLPAGWSLRTASR